MSKNNKSIKVILRNHWKRCAAIAVMTSMLCTTVTIANAAPIRFDGWTDENQEQAWAVFGMSQWNKTVTNIVFSSNGSISKSEIPDSFRNAKAPEGDPDEGKTYDEIAEKVLKEPMFANSSLLSFPSVEYKEVLLCIAYQLNKKGESLFGGNGFETEKVDVCFYSTYINPGFNIESVYESFKYLMSRYLQSEVAYRHKFSNEEGSDLFPNIYQVDSTLQAVIQGVVYGYSRGGTYSGYAKQESAYSVDSAKEFYENNKNKLPSSVTENFADFATDVTSKYSAILSLGNTTTEGW